MKNLANLHGVTYLSLAGILVSCVVAGAAAPERVRQETQEASLNEVSFTNNIRPIVASYCATCHQGADPEGDLTLKSYEDIRAQVESGDLLERINDDVDPMPPAGLMSKRQRDLFKAWADGGFVNEGDPSLAPKYPPFHPPKIEPFDISEKGGELLKRLQGHWVGKNRVMGQEFPWFAWDFRAISPAHVHTIFEGGTMGNLFTSFFIADFKRTRTIMARNGGVLNGIYRTSYFVLDRVEAKGRSTEYRFVDAYGGEGIMWMSLKFTGDDLEFKAYTSRLGLAAPPREHMSFTGKRKHPELAKAAAKAVGFPKKVVEHRFPKGLPIPDWGPELPVTSSSYIFEGDGLSTEVMGKLCGDPIRVEQMPHLSTLKVSFPRTKETEKVAIYVYLSRDPLTDRSGKMLMEYGYPREKEFDTILSFPQLTAGEEVMHFTYLHPGDYYVTAIADMNGDGYPSEGDLSHASMKVEVSPKSSPSVSVKALNVKN